MESLQEKAALSALGNPGSLRDILAFCNSNGGISDFCTRSKKFWITGLTRAGYKILALAFEPLREKYWKPLVENYAKGVHHQYYYTPSRNLMALDQYIKLETLEELDVVPKDKVLIPGLALNPQTKGWILTINFRDYENMEIPFFESITNFALCSPDEQDEARLISMLALMAKAAFQKYDDEHREREDYKRAYLPRGDPNVQAVNNADFYPNWDLSNTNARYFEEEEAPETSVYEDLIERTLDDIFFNGHLYSGALEVYRNPKMEQGREIFEDLIVVYFSAFKAHRE